MKNAQNLLKFGPVDISNMPISILKSKINFMKYLPHFRSKLVPKLNMLKIYWNLAYLIFRICRFWFKCQKIFLKYLPPVKLKLIPKIKMPRIYWSFVTFDVSNIPFSILMSKIIFVKYGLPAKPKLFPRLKMLKFIEIWHIWYFKYTDFDFNVKNNFCQIFTTCYVQISPKIKNAQNLLKSGTLDISNILISISMSKKVFMKYLPAARRN